jgi:hypothetical protein
MSSPKTPTASVISARSKPSEYNNLCLFDNRTGGDGAIFETLFLSFLGAILNLMTNKRGVQYNLLQENKNI